MARLTDFSIKSLAAPERGAVVYPDDLLSGFGVRVSEGGTKSFVLTYGPMRRRETIGRVDTITLKQARKKAKGFLAEYTLGGSKPSSTTWKEAVALFLADARRRLKAATAERYGYELNRHFRFGETKLHDIRPVDLQRKIDALVDTPRQQHHAFVTLQTFVRWAYRKHYLETNLMDRMVSDWRYRPRSRVLTETELRAVWLACPDTDFGRIVKALILTGQRVGEISNLTLEMLEADGITLPDWLVKNHRTHWFPIEPWTREHLNCLPLRPSGERIQGRYENYQRHKARLDKASAVHGWTLHDLRRTFASGLAALGVPLPVTEKLLNHVSGSFGGIVGVYQRYNYAPEMRDAVRKWEAHVRELVSIDPQLASESDGRPARAQGSARRRGHGAIISRSLTAPKRKVAASVPQSVMHPATPFMRADV